MAGYYAQQGNHSLVTGFNIGLKIITPQTPWHTRETAAAKRWSEF